MKVAVYSAGGLNRREILARLQDATPDVTELEVRMAQQRLSRIASMWD